MSKSIAGRAALFLGSCLAGAAFAQVSFAPPASYFPGGAPVAIAVRDVNGDGKADIVAAIGFSSPGKVAILLGNGAGGFTPASPLTTANSPFGVAIGDFNHDGIPDLAISTAATAQVAILLGTGGGAFAAPVAYAVGNSPNAIVIADFDGDGNADLAIACQASNAVSVLLGNGDGTFGAATAVPVGTAPFSIAAGDFNRDGIADLVTANAFSGDVSLLLGNGAGGFAPSAIATGANSQAVAVADLNRDGNADIVVGRAGVSGSVVVLLGNGNGTFGAPTAFSVSQPVQDVAIADFDGDGNADVAAVGGGGALFILAGDGTGSLATPATFSAGGSAVGIAFGDFNGDAKADVVVAGGSAGNLSVLLNNSAFVVSAQAWGYNEQGDLGNGTMVNSAVPVAVQNLTGITQISAGFIHSMALRGDGTAWAWGANYGGPLGNGNSDASSVPVQVVTDYTNAPLTNIVSVSAGYDSSLAIRSDGSVWGWGNNLRGQTGTGCFLHDTHWPLQVSGISNAIAVSSGAAYSLALKADGTVWAWGANDYGNLGDGTTAQRCSPVQVSGLTGIVAIAANIDGGHSLAIKADGTVWAWGKNDRGMIGDGSTIDRWTPVQVAGLAGVRAIAVGSFHSVVAKADGTVWAWGDNFHGQLGDGTTTPRTTPVQVPSFGGVVVVTTGQTHTVALKADGTVWAWGGNGASGQLGDGTFNLYDRVSPAIVPNISGATALSTGGQHSIFVLKGMTIAAMIGIVQAMNLPVGVSNALTGTLNAAEASYDAGHIHAACAQVGAFGRQVRAFRGKQIGTSAAEQLLGGAGRLGTSLGCGP